MDDYNKKDESIVKTKSLRMPIEVIEMIEKDAKLQNRDFTKQVLHIITKYYEIKNF